MKSSMGKVIIIGAASGTTMASNIIAKAMRSQEVEIIQMDEQDQAYISPFIPEPLIIKSVPIYEIPQTFIPKKKHRPKGHQRPYKFHK